MRDRLLTLTLALGALAAFYVLMAPKPSPPQERVTRPLSIEAGPNGYLALQRWLDAARVPSVSLRERYGRLRDTTAAAPTGNLLITTAPHLYPLRASEVQPLSDWIASGNTLLVLAGLSDTPEWSMAEGQDPAFLANLHAMTGLQFVQVPPETSEDNEAAENTESHEEEDTAERAQAAMDALGKLTEPQRSESIPNGPHPLLAGVGTVLAESEYPSAQWRALSDDTVLLALTAERSSGVPALWLRPHGAGQIVVSAYGSLFTNELLGERDNARLLANLVQWSVSATGRVLIDDAHQGLVSFYDPQKFYGDSRLHASLWWLLALWLVFVLGSRRLRAVGTEWQPLDVTTFVRATGGFMARVLKPATAAQRLFENFFNELRTRLGLTLDGAPVWDWLAARSSVPAQDLARLRELHERAARRLRIDLTELHNLLVRVRALLN